MSLVKISDIKYVNDDALALAAFDMRAYVEDAMTREMIEKAIEEHLPVTSDSPAITWWDMRNPEHVEHWYPQEDYPDGPPSFIVHYRWIVEGRWMADTERSYLKTLAIASAYGIRQRSA